MCSTVTPSVQLTRFSRQYMQLERSLQYPDGNLLRNDDSQAFLYEKLFKPGALTYPPPARYQLKVLKDLVALVEGSIDDWDEHVSSGPYNDPDIDIQEPLSDRLHVTSALLIHDTGHFRKSCDSPG